MCLILCSRLCGIPLSRLRGVIIDNNDMEQDLSTFEADIRAQDVKTCLDIILRGYANYLQL